MKILVDTQVWLWLQVAPDRVRGPALDELADERNELVFSAASAWEIAIKYAIGKLPLPEPPATYVPSRLARHGVAVLPVRLDHALAVAALPHHHGDPFDRILIAQAGLDGLRIATADPAFAAYDVPLLTA